jgi:GR25 family glycosyltransferase involved in LPS biosynthesis
MVIMSKCSHKFNDNNILSCEIVDDKVISWTYNSEILSKTTKESKVNVFYNYYKPEQDTRYREIIYCFDQLIRNKKIDHLYVLCSDELLIEEDNLTKIKIDNQPKFKDFFNLINFYTNDNDINIILNSDCYIDEENLNIVINRLDENDAFLLSRWDILSFRPFKSIHFDDINKDSSGCSQDMWIFKGKSKDDLNGNFEMGRAGCDNAIAYEFDKAGYIVSNPSLSIKIYHCHLSEIRTYGNYEINGVDNRAQHRIPPPYKFIPATRFITENMNIVFYNHFHNGDIHYSREFIKDIMKKYKANSYSYYFDLYHVCDKNIIKDCNINYLGKLPDSVLKEQQLSVIDDTIYINTWVGQNKRYFVDNYGINLKANYQIYKNIYKNLGIKLDDIEQYIPEINYDYYEKNKINKFFKGKENNLKILVSNGITRSAQCNNFDMNKTVENLSNLYNDIIFILTDSSEKIYKENIFYTDDIINKKCDLNEISYLSTYCDVIIGRASGPYAFSMTKNNMFNSKKSFICFCDKPEFEWHISSKCRHIVSDKNTNDDVFEIISDEIERILNRKKVKRIAFTIIFNGLHHLKHDNYATFIANTFDYWVIVEGASQNKGSTGWCKKMPESYHKNGKSIDGTIDYIKELKKSHNNIIFVETDGMWESKDDMVNRAMTEIRKLTRSCFLWQIDVDEQWEFNQIINSEIELEEKKCKTGKFNVIQFVGENLITTGKDWAGKPFTRLWKWKGERFKSHEPPVLDTPDNSIVLLSEKMKHYSFYFEEDVKFKNDWYTDHEGLYENWLKLKKETIFPQHITYLFPKFKESKHLENSNNLDCKIIRYTKDIENKDYEIHDEDVSGNLFNSFVNKTYVINLERRKDRLEHITKEMRKAKIIFDRFDAVDGRKLGTEYNDFKRAQIGCFKSHVGVIKDAIEKNYNVIAIFEDDIILCDDFQERFKLYIDNIPKMMRKWDIMYLGCHFHGCKSPIPIKNNIYKVIESYGCFAMILNNTNGLFQKIVGGAKSNEQKIAYDDYIKTLQPSLNTYVFMPFFVKTWETKSDISFEDGTFSYDEVNKHFENNFIKKEEEKILPSPPPPPPQLKPTPPIYIKTDQEICEDYIRTGIPFQIYHNGRLIFDSTVSDIHNLYFFKGHFTLYGRVFTYQGMMIKRK